MLQTAQVHFHRGPWSSCRRTTGYTLGSLTESEYGLTAQLSLAGTPCDAFGADITDLTIEVTYQSQTTWVSEYPWFRPC